MWQTVADKIKQHQPITTEEARALFLEASDQELQALATAAKRHWHTTDEASYLVMAIINYTNVCVAKCDYCAFYRLPHQDGTYLLDFDQLKERIDAVKALGGTLAGFNGGFHPKLKIDDYAQLFSQLHDHYKESMTFYEMTVAEFMFSCKLSKVPYEEGAKILREAGTQWVTGGGAEVLDDDFRMRHSPGKYKVEDYYDAQRALLNQNLGSTATMVIGFDESLDERLSHLSRLRQFQDDTGGRLPSFLCWTYKPYNNELGGEEISTQEYLRWIAVCRIYLNNFKHIRTSVLTKNEEALQGLLYGANDFDLPCEDEVTQKAGATVSTDFDTILNVGRQMGFKLIHRRPWHAQDF